MEWHREVNQELPSRATGVIPAVRLAEEMPRLRPLQVRPEDLALRTPVRHLRGRKKQYSSPSPQATYAGSRVWSRHTSRT